MGLSPFWRAGSSSTPPTLNSAKSARFRFSLKNKSVHFGLLAIIFLFATGCSSHDQSTWQALGPVAQKQLDLFNVLLWVMVAVFIVVEGILLYAIIRYRKRPGQPRPPQLHGHTVLELTWTVIPTILVLALGVWSVFALFDIDKPDDKAGEPLHVTVTGHQWWFEFEYPDAGNGKRITTANDLRIPVDVPISLTLLSDDVIHSFWVPNLAGKLDMIPTRSNEMWFQADSNKIDQALPVTISGQCAELCGLAHALMRFDVTIMDQSDFDSWVESYSPPPTSSPKAKAGQQVFAANCTLCHTINGADDPAQAESRLKGFLTGGDIVAVPAPNLTDLRTRQTLAAGIIELSETNLINWIRDPEEIKPGNYMSDKAIIYQNENGIADLSDQEISNLVSYLLNLP